MTPKKYLGFMAMTLLATTLVCSQATAQVEYSREFNSEFFIKAFDNTTFCTAFLSKGGVPYAMRDIQLTVIHDFDDIVFNPTGSAIALMLGSDDVSIYSFQKANKRIAKLKEERKEVKKRPNLPFEMSGELGQRLMKLASKKNHVTLAMAYSADARNFITSNSMGEIIIYDTKEYQPQAYIQGKSPATALAMSSNNYYIAAATGNNIDIWNFRTREIRQSIPMSALVTDLTFSDDAMTMVATTADNKISVFETRNWELTDTYAIEGAAIHSPTIHPDGKYLAVAVGDDAITLLNLKNKNIEQEIQVLEGGIKGVKFIIDKQLMDVFLITNGQKKFLFYNANQLNPYYGKLVRAEADARMNEWMKMMQGETMEDYAIRVNDETRLQQQQLFMQEVATEMAGDRISIDNPFVGEYDAESNMLSIGFNALPTINLEMSAADAATFGAGTNLSFGNAVYIVNDQDEFELAYVEVTNETTGSVFIFDNIGRTKLNAIEADDNFVPLEVMQLANMEEIQLMEMKETVVEESKDEKLISDNTQIDVHTQVIPSTDANGNKILNYQIGYQYQVLNREFSANEDFPSGGYNIEKSNAAMSMMKIIEKSFEGDFAKYLSEGKQVKMIITGSADASPIRGVIRYDGRYGDFEDEPYYKDGNLDNITVTKVTGITNNEQLALIRAAGVKYYVEQNVSTLANTDNEYEYHLEVATETGGQYRKISIEFVIMDAFPVN